MSTVEAHDILAPEIQLVHESPPGVLVGAASNAPNMASVAGIQ
jgi:hypothetical protein